MATTKQVSISAAIDSALQDIAQTVGGLTYMQIYKFGKVVTKEDLKIIRKLINIFRDAENENAAKMVAKLINYRIENLTPIDIVKYTETVDNWGRTESSSKAKIIAEVLAKPKEFSDDMFFTGKDGVYDIDEIESQIVKTGKIVTLVGNYSDKLPSFVL